MLKMICLGCGKEFSAYPYEVREGRKYCSKHCASKSEHAKKEKGKRAKRAWQNPETRERMIIGIYKRSQSKKWQDSPQFQKGKNHPRYRGNKRERTIHCSQYKYVQWRNAIFRRDDYTCQECDKHGGRLQAHHIKNWADYPELRYEINNGITLCTNCHSKIHGRELLLPIKRCEYCNRPFPYTRRSRKYCSKECSDKAQIKKISVICPYCGSEFERPPSRIGKTKSSLNFCSGQCREAYFRIHGKPK